MWCKGNETQELRSVLLQRPCPSLAHSPSLEVVPKDPFQVPLHLGRPLLQDPSASSHSGPLGFLPLPISAFPQPPGKGLAHLPASSCLAVTHLVLTGCPSLAGSLLGCCLTLLVLPGAPVFLLPGGRLTRLAWPQGLPPCFFRAEFLQSHCARYHSVGISFVIIIFKAYLTLKKQYVFNIGNLKTGKVGRAIL